MSHPPICTQSIEVFGVRRTKAVGRGRHALHNLLPNPKHLSKVFTERCKEGVESAQALHRLSSTSWSRCGEMSLGATSRRRALGRLAHDPPNHLFANSITETETLG